MSFEIDAETLHCIVTENMEGPCLLKSFGGLPGLAKKLKANPFRDLSAEDEEELQTRRAAFVVNELLPAEEVTFMDFVWDSLGGRKIQLLVASAVVSFVIGFTLADAGTGRVDSARG
ncbi:putative P-type ATPase [Trypanosoma cruzi]|nr:putative P-type ATPase [Trypanosoma cruzi]